ncbi:hypothetical protein BC940DRAFT_310085 [Gongronella butleri]|nr:hypothetical protein BC940DRAFT_310085 [Gongronella butleri]
MATPDHAEETDTLGHSPHHPKEASPPKDRVESLTCALEASSLKLPESESQSPILAATVGTTDTSPPQEETQEQGPRREQDQVPAQQQEEAGEQEEAQQQEETRAQEQEQPQAPVQQPAQEYLVKTMQWLDPELKTVRAVRIITQNENGPCPLICICNILFIRGDIEIRPFDRPSVTFDYLMELLGDYLLTHAPDAKAPSSGQDQPQQQHATTASSPTEIEDVDAKDNPPANNTTTDTRDVPTRQATAEYLLTYRHNLDSALTLLPRLQSGLDVNVQFGSIRDFEPTSELALFDLFDVDIVHGWIVDPQDQETHRVVVKQCKSYNGVVECVVRGNEISDDSGSLDSSQEKREANDIAIHDGLVASTFLQDTATQLTYYGIELLTDSLRNGNLCVLFRNNHFSTLYKHPESDRLYILVTDSGLVREENIIWETLGDIDQGTSEFVDSYFLPPGTRQPPFGHDPKMTDLDYALAVSIQEEEERQQQQRQRQQRGQRADAGSTASSTPAASNGASPASNTAAKPTPPLLKKKSCIIS